MLGKILDFICTRLRSTEIALDSLSLVQYDFCRTKTHANKILYLTKRCRITYNYSNDFKPISIDQIDNDYLGSEITEAEIRNAIFTLNKDKSAGQDGITSEFYQQFWPKLTHILKEVYIEILENGELSPTMKNGLITLIYKKKGDPSVLKFWRPITLLTVDYKILSKILTTRLSKHMND